MALVDRFLPVGLGIGQVGEVNIEEQSGGRGSKRNLGNEGLGCIVSLEASDWLLPAVGVAGVMSGVPVGALGGPPLAPALPEVWGNGRLCHHRPNTG